MKIDDLIGARYEVGGRGPDAYDCFGLFAELCRRRGMALPEFSYGVTPEEQSWIISGETAREWVKLGVPEPGCAVLFRIIPPFVSHIGMVLEGGKFIHVRRGANVAIERLDSIVWRSRIAGYYSHE